jgi:hypothetical protein
MTALGELIDLFLEEELKVCLTLPAKVGYVLQPQKAID